MSFVPCSLHSRTGNSLQVSKQTKNYTVVMLPTPPTRHDKTVLGLVYFRTSLEALPLGFVELCAKILQIMRNDFKDYARTFCQLFFATFCQKPF